MTDTFSIPPELLARLRHARHVAALTGAGVSAESGMPTFREAQTGLWAQYDPMTLATPEAFAENPKLVWEWYAWRRKLVSEVAPNPGHDALVELATLVPRFTLITQNVDGLHQRAGSQNVIELHGNITRVRRATDGVVVEQWEQVGEEPPRCPQTGSLLRPDIVWFGEMLPAAEIDAAREAAYTCDVFLSIGTSGQVEPAASLPRLALARGAVVVIINPEVELRSSESLWVLRGPSGVVLPTLVAALRAGEE